jgi:hypothetical protein
LRWIRNGDDDGTGHHHPAGDRYYDDLFDYDDTGSDVKHDNDCDSHQHHNRTSHDNAPHTRRRRDPAASRRLCAQ